MSKRTSSDSDFAIVRPRRKRNANPCAFMSNKYLQGLYDQLHTNVLYAWLRGDLGDIDDPVVTRDYIWNLWTDMNTHGFFTVGYITEFYVDREIIFWKNMFPNGNVETVWRESESQVV